MPREVRHLQGRHVFGQVFTRTCGLIGMDRSALGEGHSYREWETPWKRTYTQTFAKSVFISEDF